MDSTNIVKVVAAFVGGMVIALGSSLIYLQVSNRTSRESPSFASPSNASPPAVNRPELPQSLPDGGSDAGAESDGDKAQPERAIDNSPSIPKTKMPANHRVIRKSRAVGASAGPPAINKDTVVAADERPSPPELQAQASQPQSATSSAPQPLPATPPGTLPAAAETPVAAVVTPPRREPRTVTLSPGTTLIIRLAEALSTDHNYTGDTFRATLDQPIISGAAIIADRGSKVLGRVVNAQRAGRVQGVSDLALTLFEIHTTDGQRVSIQSSSLDRKGPEGRKGDAAKVGGGAALGAIIGAISGGGKGAGIGAGVGGAAGAGDVLLTRGKPAVFQNEARLVFSLTSPLVITEKLNY